MEEQNPHAEGQPIGPEAAPTFEYLSQKRFSVISRCQRIRVRSDVHARIIEDLRLESASPEKRLYILEVIREIESNREIFLANRRLNAAYVLKVEVYDWVRKNEAPII